MSPEVCARWGLLGGKPTFSPAPRVHRLQAHLFRDPGLGSNTSLGAESRQGQAGQGGPFPRLLPYLPHLPSLLGDPEHHARSQGREPTFCFSPRSPHPLDHCRRLQPPSGAPGPGSAPGRGQASAAPRASSCWPSPSAPAPAGLSWAGRQAESDVHGARRKQKLVSKPYIPKHHLSAPSSDGVGPRMKEYSEAAQVPPWQNPMAQPQILPPLPWGHKERVGNGGRAGLPGRERSPRAWSSPWALGHAAALHSHWSLQP